MSVRNDPRGNPTYRCRAKGHCCWPACPADRYVANVIVARLARDRFAHQDRETPPTGTPRAESPGRPADR